MSKLKKCVMLTETEIKIIALLKDPYRTLDLTTQILDGCADLSDSIYSLHRKGVVIQSTITAEEDPLADLELTEFGKLAKLKLP